MANPTARTPIGATGLSLTRFGLGTAPLGNLFQEVPEDDAQATFSAAFDAGIRYVDTAPLYGYGLAESRAGRALAQYPRSAFVVSTKVGRLLREGARGAGETDGDGETFYRANPQLYAQFDFSYDGVMRSLEESLERLGLEQVDIVYIHDPDDHYDAAVKGAYRALDRLRRDGVIRAVGAGMNQWQMLSRFLDDCDFDCVLLAGRYTLLEQPALAELLPKCLARNVAVINGGVFNSGLLANPLPGATYNYVQAPPELIERSRRIAAVCARHDVPLMAAALQFPLGHPAVASVLSGVKSAAELHQNLRMFELPIPARLWDDLKAAGLLDPAAPVPDGG